jgi:hypothetical protein
MAGSELLVAPYSKDFFSQRVDYCEVCRRKADKGRTTTFLLCSQTDCTSHYHLACVGLSSVPDGDWFCPVHRVEPLFQQIVETGNMYDDDVVWVGVAGAATDTTRWMEQLLAQGRAFKNQPRRMLVDGTTESVWIGFSSSAATITTSGRITAYALDILPPPNHIHWIDATSKLISRIIQVARQQKGKNPEGADRLDLFWIRFELGLGLAQSTDMHSFLTCLTTLWENHVGGARPRMMLTRQGEAVVLFAAPALIQVKRRGEWIDTEDIEPEANRIYPV